MTVDRITPEHLGDTATVSDLDLFLDHLEDAAAEAGVRVGAGYDRDSSGDIVALVVTHNADRDTWDGICAKAMGGGW